MAPETYKRWTITFDDGSALEVLASNSYYADIAMSELIDNGAAHAYGVTTDSVALWAGPEDA